MICYALGVSKVDILFVLEILRVIPLPAHSVLGLADIANLLNLSRYRSFLKMMFKWNGAVFKLIWHDLLLFIVLFFVIDSLYILWLKKDPELVYYKELFELICIYCGR